MNIADLDFLERIESQIEEKPLTGIQKMALPRDSIRRRLRLVKEKASKLKTLKLASGPVEHRKMLASLRIMKDKKSRLAKMSEVPLMVEHARFPKMRVISDVTQTRSVLITQPVGQQEKDKMD